MLRKKRFMMRARGRVVTCMHSEARGVRGHPGIFVEIWGPDWKCITNFANVMFLWAFRRLEWVKKIKGTWTNRLKPPPRSVPDWTKWAVPWVRGRSRDCVKAPIPSPVGFPPLCWRFFPSARPGPSCSSPGQLEALKNVRDPAVTLFTQTRCMSSQLSLWADTFLKRTANLVPAELHSSLWN